MKHYTLRKPNVNPARAQPLRNGKQRHIEVILLCEKDRTSVELVAEFYRALNTLIGEPAYTINRRLLSEGSSGGPLYWADRTAVFWGDFENAWTLERSEKKWVSQVLSLSRRTILVGGSVFLMAEVEREDKKRLAIHPNFEAAARETGLICCNDGTRLSSESQVHSATTRLSALRLFSEFVSIDHGEYLAGALSAYVGLTETTTKLESRLAALLIRRANGDQLIGSVLETMLDNIEEPLKISDLSNRVNASTRQVQRRFLEKTGCKPSTTYKELRLERAHSLLRYTELPQIEISMATGFSSKNALARAFHDHYKTLPESVRNQRYLGSL